MRCFTKVLCYPCCRADWPSRTLPDSTVPCWLLNRLLLKVATKPLEIKYQDTNRWSPPSPSSEEQRQHQSDSLQVYLVPLFKTNLTVTWIVLIDSSFLRIVIGFRGQGRPILTRGNLPVVQVGRFE